MSKGSAQRPRTIADNEWEARWDAIFGKDKPAKEEKKEEEWVQLELDPQTKKEE
jgi:hypothetical protein